MLKGAIPVTQMHCKATQMHSNPCKTQTHTHTHTQTNMSTHTQKETQRARESEREREREKERQREREREAEQGTSDQPYELLPTAGHDARFGGGQGVQSKGPIISFGFATTRADAAYNMRTGN